MIVIWSAASVRHLKEVVEYIQDKSPARAKTIQRRILAATKLIGQMPHSGRKGRVDGTREAVVPRTLHIVVYQVSAGRIEILGIRHGARDWQPSF